MIWKRIKNLWLAWWAWKPTRLCSICPAWSLKDGCAYDTVYVSEIDCWQYRHLMAGNIAKPGKPKDRTYWTGGYYEIQTREPVKVDKPKLIPTREEIVKRLQDEDFYIRPGL